MFERRERSEEQQELWVMAGEWPPATPDGFYRRVNKTLESIGFASQVWDICEPAYADPSKGGRPGIDPVVSLKMLTVGFFEDLPGERAIARRCAESLSIRGYLGYSLTEATPDHSSLSVIRERLSIEQLEAMHRVLLGALHEHGRLRGRKPGIGQQCDGGKCEPAGIGASQHRGELLGLREATRGGGWHRPIRHQDGAAL